MNNTTATATEQWKAIVAELKKSLPADKAVAKAVEEHPQLHREMLAEMKNGRKVY